jgi:23S rRNA pseudouridine2605 synthase
MAESERVQKILAKAGLASRRKCEELIVEGSVTINGKTAKLGDKAQFGKDAIKVNGRLLQAVESKTYLAFYKPRAVISMLVDNENRPNLSDYLSKLKARVFPIGRLDFNSEGLILLTNDGDFAEQMQKREDITRVYTVKVKGKVDAEAVHRLEKGARINYRMIRPHSVRVLKEMDAKTHVQLVILGGGAVDIRALCEMKGLLVDKITRTAIGHLTLRGLVPGHFRFLKPSQALALLEQPELGLKMLAADVADDKPKGQRNFHPKKERPIEDTITKKPAPRGAAAFAETRPERREQRTSKPGASKPGTRKPFGSKSSSSKPMGSRPTRGKPSAAPSAYGVVKPTRSR